MNKAFFLLMVFLTSYIGHAQKINYPVNNRVIINHQDYIIYAHFSMDDIVDIKVDDNKFYYWYSLNDIKRTRGGYDGKILDGLYTEYYPNKSLKEKGEFDYGLKVGVWKSWYINGEKKEHYFYKKGLPHKAFVTYYPNGRVKEEGYFVHGLPHKEVKRYDSTGVLIRRDFYKKGVLVEEKILKHKKRRGIKIKGNPQDTLGFIQKIKKKISRKARREKSAQKADTSQTQKPTRRERRRAKRDEKRKERDAIRIQRIKKIVPGDSPNNNI